VISVSVSKVALNNRLRLKLLSDIFIFILYSIESASKGNKPLALELIATFKH
jgi:hypothetical protein